MTAYRAVQGVKDILPEQSALWEHFEKIIKTTCGLFGYQRIETPIFEETGVYARGVGEGTDIVEKEMYTFKDRGDTSLTLEPEGTAGVVRAYIEHGMQMKPQPVKLFYVRTPIFRYERPQKGRLREHHQFGCEAIGESDPMLDAELISVIWSVYTRMGLTNLSIQLNSIGDKACKPGYMQKLIEYYTPLQDDLCADCKVRFTKNPLRLLDCKEERDQPKIAHAPKIAEYLCADCEEHFALLKQYLEEMHIPYTLNPLLVRGLDYYTRTVFELISEDIGGRQNAIGGGGRYDGLIELLGGKPTPAIGFGSGMERAIALLEQQKGTEIAEKQPEVYIIALNAMAKRKAAEFANTLREKDIKTLLGFGSRSLKAFMKAANASGAQWAVIIGEEEAQTNTVALRNLRAGADDDHKQVSLSVEEGLQTILRSVQQ